MKRTLLALLMIVMITTPCFAQEIETEGLFSIEGTTWKCIGVAIQILEPPFISLYNETVIFEDRTVQTTSGNIGILQYGYPPLDFLVLSVARAVLYEGAFRRDYATMVLQPTIGVGMFSSIIREVDRYSRIDKRFIGFGFGFMFKVDDDDWTPPEGE